MNNDSKPFLGKYQQQIEYKSFLPPKINQSFVWNDEVTDVLLEEAATRFVELNKAKSITARVN